MQQTQQHFSATEYELQQQQPQYLGKHDAAVKYMQQLGLHKQNIKVDSEVCNLVSKHFTLLAFFL
jgi:hypothetical protein